MRRNLATNWHFLPAILIGFPGVSCRIQALGTVDRPPAKRYLSLCQAVRLSLLGPRKQQGARAMIIVRRLSIFVLLIPCCAQVASAQSDPADNRRRPAVQQTRAACLEA